jgi:uncharacterized protein (TIRG00374 family)
VSGWRGVWMRLLPLGIGLGVITLLILWVNPASMFRLLSQANLRFLMLGVLSYIVAILIRSQKLHLYLNLLGSVERIWSLGYYVIGTFLALITPARMGEPIVSVLIKREQAIAISSLLPLLVTDRLMDFAVILAYGALSLLWVGPESATVLPNVSIWPLMALAATLGLLISLGVRQLVPKYHWLQEMVNNAKLSLGLMCQRPNVLAASIGLTLLSWLFEIGAMFSTVRAFGVALSYTQVMAMFCLGTLAGVISMIPGGTGAAEASMAGLALLWGAEKERIISALLLNKVLLTVYISLAALAFTYAARRRSRSSASLELL